MSYKLSFESKGDVIWVRANGTRSFKAVLALSMDVMAACERKGTSKVLIDVRELEGRLSTAESYSIPVHHFPKIREQGHITKAAIVDRLENESTSRFFEDVAVNRGFLLRLFTDTRLANEWLIG